MDNSKEKIKRYYSRCLYGGYEPSDFKPSGAFEGKINRSVHSWKKTLVLVISVALVAIVLLFASCKTKEIPVEVKYETRYTDSVVMKDSVIVIPIEQIVDIVPWYDTLHLETTMAFSDAWIDTSFHILQGRLVNKQGKIVEIKYVDRVQVRDSIVVQEKPIYVTETVENIKRPWWAWICLTWTIISLLSIAWGIYRKFRL